MVVNEEKVIRVYDKNLIFLKEISDFTAGIYHSKWNTYGTFEFYLPERIPCIEKDNIIIWNHDTRKNGVIKYIECSDEKGVVVKGYSLLYLLRNRIALPPDGLDYDVLEGSHESCMITLMEHNVINPANESRKMPLWEREENQARGEKTKYQARHEEILDALTELSKASLLGIGANVDLARKKIVFEIKEGIDKTIQQHERPPVVFSDTRGNVDNRAYILNDADSRNCAYVAGQGEGAERTIVVVGDEYAGADRREVLIDARDVEDAAELPERGRAKLADMLPAESYTTDVEVDGYEDKWFLGDFVTVFDEEYGVTLMKQVLEVEEDMDENGYIVTPTFGIPEKTISEKVSSSGSGAGGGSSIGQAKYNIGSGLKLDIPSNTLSVDTAKDFEGDNTRPVETAFVETIVGNIEIILKTI